VNDPDYDAAKFDRLFAINVGGVVSAVRAAAPFLGEGGRIISIGSGAGTSAPWPGIADYAASKAAVALYTRGWARDLGSHGITVNVVQPGPINTEMNPEDGGLSRQPRRLPRLSVVMGSPRKSRQRSHSSPALKLPTSPVRC
jgi:3-oxoacyl-[acyl-carrier protein] reductase